LPSPLRSPAATAWFWVNEPLAADRGALRRPLLAANTVPSVTDCPALRRKEKRALPPPPGRVPSTAPRLAPWGRLRNGGLKFWGVAGVPSEGPSNAAACRAVLRKTCTV